MGGFGGGVDWVASYPLFGETKHKKIEKGLEYNLCFLVRYLIVISTLWHC